MAGSDPVDALAEQMSLATLPVELGASAGAVQPGEGPQIYPVIEVAFGWGKWWSIPFDMSKDILEKSKTFKTVVYTWDWADTRPGAFVIHHKDGSTEQTSINRYCLDFETMTIMVITMPSTTMTTMATTMPSTTMPTMATTMTQHQQQSQQ